MYLEINRNSSKFKIRIKRMAKNCATTHKVEWWPVASKSIAKPLH